MTTPRWRGPALAAGAAAACFLPVLRHGFVNWDDDVVLSHPSLGSLDPRWMLTSVYSATWQPLTWLVDSSLVAAFGRAPAVFHTANLALHCAASALLFLVARRLYALACVPRARAETAALFAALLLAVHPLSAEPAAWVSAKGDLLSAVFFLGAVLAYLSGALDARRRGLVFALFVLSCLARWKGALLPAALMILDEYPLRRRAPAEKVPFLAVSAAVVAANALAKSRAYGYAGALRPLEAGAGLVLFATKWLAPVKLLPVYEVGAGAGVWPLLGAAALTGGLVLLRRRRPELLAAWAFFCAALAPVLLFSAPGEPLALHDYHAYLACAGFAALAGAGLARVPAAGWLLVAGLAFGARAQALVWRDSETLWRATLAKAPASPHALFRLSLELQRQGRFEEALVPAEKLYALDERRGRSVLEAARAGVAASAGR